MSSLVPLAAVAVTTAVLATTGEGKAALPGPRVHLSDPSSGDVGRYSLPVPDSVVGEADLRAPHHDYPASDLMVPVGTPVFAVHAGTVTTHEGQRCGLGVSVRGDDGYRSVVCHLARVTVTDGIRVRAGDVVGLSGDTGNARGVPHVHLHLLGTGGRYLCPQPLLVAWWRGDDVGPREREVVDGCTFRR